MSTLVIGSTGIDLFVKPDEKQLKIHDGSLDIKLGDKIPTNLIHTSVGGNASNVSIALRKLGENADIYTYIGKDFFAHEIIASLKSENVKVVSPKDLDIKTSFSLIMPIKSERVIFSYHDEFDHDFEIENTYDFAYVTSIGDKWEEAYKKINTFVKKNDITLAFSPGSRQMQNINEEFLKTLKNSHLFFSNKEEAVAILHKVGLSTESDKTILENIKNLGPVVVSITDGENGAFAADDNQMLRINKINATCEEKTGAGDAYAAAFLAAYIKNYDIKRCMKWGVLNSGNVISKIGAHNGLLDGTLMEEKEKMYTNHKAQSL